MAKSRALLRRGKSVVMQDFIDGEWIARKPSKILIKPKSTNIVFEAKGKLIEVVKC